ncbi:MAG: tRNA preQ1(34) S-adenosylmethionine ribosyltransferase-isomerase QueA [Planctomycetota bacterium]
MNSDLDFHISSYDYHLPRELIAQRPLDRRDASRLLVLDRKSSQIEHSTFDRVGSFLRAGDILVLNDTRVFRNRLICERARTGGKVEVFLLEPPFDLSARAITRSGGKLRVGEKLLCPGGVTCVIEEFREQGERIVRFDCDPKALAALLEAHAAVPLPPYISREPDADDFERYQTVYAARDGAVAAPTAGFHFTPQLISQLKESGIRFATVTLHVGRGTFEPVKVNDIREHKMHSEWYEINSENAEMINQAKADGGRIIPVGTTSVRVLESVADDSGLVREGTGETSIFIYPPYRFKACDALFTNFHLPKSTLLMLVSALAGKEAVFNAYAEAVALRYRFFSYGDAMFIK